MVRRKQNQTSRLSDHERRTRSWVGDSFNVKNTPKEKPNLIVENDEADSLEQSTSSSSEGTMFSSSYKEEASCIAAATDFTSFPSSDQEVGDVETSEEMLTRVIPSVEILATDNRMCKLRTASPNTKLHFDLNEKYCKRLDRSVAVFGFFSVKLEIGPSTSFTNLLEGLPLRGRKLVTLVAERRPENSVLLSRRFLAFKIDQKKTAWLSCTSTDLPFECITALSTPGLFAMFVCEESNGELKIQINICEAAICNDPLEPGRRNAYFALRKLMKHFHGIAFYDWDLSLRGYKENIPRFYRALKDSRKSKAEHHDGIDLQHPALIPRLRPYQKDAVGWMLNRELSGGEAKGLDDVYKEVRMPDGTVLFYCPNWGLLLRHSPRATLQSPPGGILAEEMGLGKTVEILALVLHNPKLGVSSDNCEIMSPPPEEPCCSMMADEEMNIRAAVEDVMEELVSEVSAQVDRVEEILSSPKRPRYMDVLQKRNADMKERKRKAKVSLVYIPPKSLKMRKDRGLECMCGWHDGLKFEDSTPRIQCVKCKSWQHKECVGWTWDDENTYFCPHCSVNRPEPIETGATLIVSPASICHQWYEEIKKHIRKYSLKVYIYKGVIKEGFVQPRLLAEQDIVICTYEVFRSEVHFLDLEPNNRFRHARRFITPPSPITAIRWWRVCLDEAQMVEGVSTSAAALCLRLSAVNRWCVTGTPIQKSVEDLYGLILYLGLAPYWVHAWWERLLYIPYTNDVWTPMLDVISEVVWRTEKIDVLNQLNIPPQEQELQWFDFSPVEEHFYRRILMKCKEDVSTALRQINYHEADRISDMDRDSVEKIIRPSLQLRRACCHPQITQTGRIIHLKQKMMTMEEVLEKMIKDTTRECCEDHRLLVAAHNGLAGIHWLNSEWAEAAEQYRKVLRSCVQHSGMLTTDKLQQIHALHNLGELTKRYRAQVPPTLRDESLSEEATQLKQKYLEETETQIAQSKQDLEQMVRKVKLAVTEMKDGLGWFATVGHCCVMYGLELDLISKVRETLFANRGSTGASLQGRFSDSRGLNLVLHTQYEQLMSARGALSKGIKELCDLDLKSPQLNDEATQCHLRPAGGLELENCPVCRTHKLFELYESKLFNFEPDQGEGTTVMKVEEEDVTFHGKLRRGTWQDSPLQQALKCVYHFARARERYFEPEDLEFGKKHLELVEMFKKEFRSWRAVWMAIRDHVSQRDEVMMATERIRFKSQDEIEMERMRENLRRGKHHQNFDQEAEKRPLNAIHPVELGVTRLKLQNDLAVAKVQLERKLGHLGYLKNLEKMKSENLRDNSEECPVCKQTLGRSWALLVCGHCYCCDCIHNLVSRFGVGCQQIKCPVCRDPTHRANISYVSTRTHHDEEDGEGIEVKGSHSTKVEAVVRCLLKIRQKEPGAKCLVFSTWQEVLQIVAKALDENRVPQLFLRSQSQESCVAKFRTSTDFNILLLPVHSGANGLNLVEATHVILVEPLLNLASEQQAIGRVHRMGQKRKTTVHRFLVRGTIEERIHCFLGEHKSEEALSMEKENSLTVGQFSELFK